MMPAILPESARKYNELIPPLWQTPRMTALSSLDALKPIDHRKEPRQRVLKAGKLYYGAFSPTVIDCLVVELSDNGLRVETPEMTQVPELFKVRVGDSSVQRARRCWTRGHVIGIEFLDHLG